MSSADRRAFAHIDLKAFANNVSLIKAGLTHGTKLMAVVKANAYGHGAVRCAAEALSSGADMLGVATVGEAAELRRSGIEADILVLSEPFAADCDGILKLNLIGSICSARGGEELSRFAAATGIRAPVHIKIDTGMNRVGFKTRDFDGILKIFELPGLNVTGIYTHLADAMNPDEGYARAQFGDFSDLLDKLEARGISGLLRHVSNSGGIIRHREFDLDMVRAGSIIYGIFSEEELGDFKDIRPVMSLVARIAQVKDIAPGETVGYSRTFTAGRPTRIAVASIGYADGLSRQLSNNGSAIVRGKIAPIVGIVCMDAVMLDVTDIPGVEAGDCALFIGEEGGASITAPEMAATAGTVSLNVTAMIGGRVERVYR
ncbi:MAG: alanine racemase [Clostridiales bacterium]|nr:alanine racemase [Clostridiales bacterium]